MTLKSPSLLRSLLIAASFAGLTVYATRAGARFDERKASVVIRYSHV